jgi:hypothetical protein
MSPLPDSHVISQRDVIYIQYHAKTVMLLPNELACFEHCDLLTVGIVIYFIASTLPLNLIYSELHTTVWRKLEIINCMPESISTA